MWADLVAWFQSPGGARVMQSAVLPVLGVLVAALVAVLIGRAAVRSALGRADREQATVAIAGLVEAARAAGGPAESRSAARRSGRLRTEADVRMRMLPLPDAPLAADWAADRIDALQQQQEDSGAGADEVRDALVAWAAKPKRAKRLFVQAPPRAAAPSRTPESVQPPREDRPAPAQEERVPAEQESAAVDAPTDRGRASAADPEPAAPRSTAVAVTAEEAPEVAAAASRQEGDGAEEAVPAWRRTRAGERLQRERAGRAPAEPTTPAGEETDQEPSVETAPVRMQHPHRAAGLPVTDADETVRAEAHQQARHARGDDGAEPEESPAPEPEQPEPQRRAPRKEFAWLDDYDDEAQVTQQRMDLRTPRPVSATSVRDRTPSGEDIVPRT